VGDKKQRKTTKKSGEQSVEESDCKQKLPAKKRSCTKSDKRAVQNDHEGEGTDKKIRVMGQQGDLEGIKNGEDFMPCYYSSRGRVS